MFGRRAIRESKFPRRSNSGCVDDIYISPSSPRYPIRSFALNRPAQDCPRRWTDFVNQMSPFGLDIQCRLFKERISLHVVMGKIRQRLIVDVAVNISSKDPTTI